MDRSFLFDAEVIEASRDFVCIRLATYEDSAEAEFLRTVYVGRKGELENTVFCLLSPDTKTNLCRPGRGPHFSFRSAGDLADGMKKITLAYPGHNERTSESAVRLPQMKDFRLGLNVSSCDGLPTVVCVGADEDAVKSLGLKAATLAFDESLAGKFGYATTAATEDLSKISGYEAQQGFVVIEPGQYGTDGKMVKAFDADVSIDELKSYLVEYANGTAKVSKDRRTHVNGGGAQGIDWETEIPVTDSGSLKAKERFDRSKK